MSSSISKLIAYIFAAALFGLLAVLLAVPRVKVEAAIDREEHQIIDLLGDDTSASIFRQADDWYASIFVQTGFKNAVYSYFTPTDKQVAADKKMSDLGAGFFVVIKTRLYTTFSVLYIGFVRIFMLLSWVPALAPLMFASIYDGLQRRRVRMLTFQPLSARVFGLTQHVIALLALSPLLYLIWPFNVNPIILPIMLLASCFFLREMVSNYQR